MEEDDSYGWPLILTLTFLCLVRPSCKLIHSNRNYIRKMEMAQYIITIIYHRMRACKVALKIHDKTSL